MQNGPELIEILEFGFFYSASEGLIGSNFYYLWSEPSPMNLKLAQRLRMVRTSKFMDVVFENPSNTDRVVGDCIQS